MTKAIRAFVLLVAVIAAGGILWNIFSPGNGAEINQDELAKLVKRARLTWEDYGEGIKASLGATPAAHWHGAPIEARLAADEIEVTFDLKSPWRQFSFGMPILLRDPEGRVLEPSAFAQSSAGGVYTFRHEAPLTPLAVPWVELRYPPNEEQRIVFDSTGAWHAPAN